MKDLAGYLARYDFPSSGRVIEPKANLVAGTNIVKSPIRRPFVAQQL